MQVGDVIGLDDEIGRVLGERQPVTEDLDVLRLTVEERGRPTLSVRTIAGCVRLRDMEEHGQVLRSGAAVLRVGDLSAWKTRGGRMQPGTSARTRNPRSTDFG